MFNKAFREEILPYVQPDCPLEHFEAFSSHTGCVGAEADLHLSRSFFQAVVEHNKASLRPFLQAKQSLALLICLRHNTLLMMQTHTALPFFTALFIPGTPAP